VGQISLVSTVRKSSNQVGEAAKELGMKMKVAYDHLKKAVD
jgi:hypothetical protein